MPSEVYSNAMNFSVGKCNLGLDRDIGFAAVNFPIAVIRAKPAMTVRIGDYIVSTARNRALPSATRS